MDEQDISVLRFTNELKVTFVFRNLRLSHWVRIQDGSTFDDILTEMDQDGMFPSFGFEESFRLVDDFRKLLERITNDDLNKIVNNPIRLVEGIKLEPLSSDALETFYQYEEVANGITKANSLNHLLLAIEKAGNDLKCREDNYRGLLNTPFVFIGLPSYSGKTQATLTLDHYSEHPFKFQPPENKKQAFADVHRIKACIHLVMSGKTSGCHQKIYELMRKYSFAWRKELRNDEKALKLFLKSRGRKISILSASDIVKAGQLPLKSLGFICSLLEARINGWDEDYINTGKSLEYEPKTLFEARELFRKARERLPVVFTLDEFNSSSRGKRRLLIFARNLLRELGAIVVISGTDAHASTFVHFDTLGGHSRGSGIVYPSAYLVTDLPKATRSSLPMDIDNFRSRFAENHFAPFKNWLTRVDENSVYTVCKNPGLLKIFYQELCKFLSDKPEGSCTAVDTISSVLKSSINQVLANKKTLNLENGRAAEFIMCLSQRRLRDSENRQVSLYPDRFMQDHFAAFDLHGAKPTIYKTNERTETLNGVITLWRRREAAGLRYDIGDRNFRTFTPSCLFNEFKCDELSYLLLLSFYGFREITRKDEAGVSFRTVSTLAHTTLGMTSSGSCNSQIAEPRPEFFLENTVAGSVIMASNESVEGVQLSSFLRNMICELSDPSEFDLSLTIPEELETVCTPKVPYIPCEGLDALCSKEFNQIPNVFTGLFTMTQNQEQCDGILMSRLIFEVEKHVKSCGSCSGILFKNVKNEQDGTMISPLDAAEILLNLMDDQKIEIQCLLNHLESVGIRPDSNALKGLVKIFFDLKNLKDGIDGDDLEQILRRLVNNIMTNPVYPLVKTHVCIIVTTTFKMKNDKDPVDRISDFFKGKVHVAKRAGSNSKEIKLELFHDFGAHQKKTKPAEKRAHTEESADHEETAEVVGQIIMVADVAAEITGNAVKSQADTGMEPERKRTKPAENVEESVTSNQPLAAMAVQPTGGKNPDEGDKAKFTPTHEQAQNSLVILLPLEELFSEKLVMSSFGTASERQ